MLKTRWKIFRKLPRRVWHAFVALLLSTLMLSSVAFARPTLYWGSRGPEVKALQSRLSIWGYFNGTVDGIFGPTTAQAVRYFQAQNGLTVDGVVGAQTWTNLGLAEPEPTSPLVMGFYVEDGNVSTSALWNQLSSLDAISPYWWSLTSNGEVQTRGYGDAATVTRLMHANGKKVYVLVTNNGSAREFWDQAAMNNAVANLAAEAEAMHVDGVVLDVEAVNTSLRDGLSEFTRKVADRMHALGLKTMETVGPNFSDNPATNPMGYLYDYAAIGQSVDKMIVMTYDLRGQGGTPGPLAPMSWVQNVVKYTLTKVPADKVILGLANYGYNWFKTGGGWRITAHDAIALAGQLGAPIVWDAAAKEPHFTYWDGAGLEHNVWFEDSYSIADKLALVKQDHLAGVAMWKLGGANAGYWSVVDRALKG